VLKLEMTLEVLTSNSITATIKQIGCFNLT
jgi:hypothetical protein